MRTGWSSSASHRCAPLAATASVAIQTSRDWQASPVTIPHSLFVPTQGFLKPTFTRAKTKCRDLPRTPAPFCSPPMPCLPTACLSPSSAASSAAGKRRFSSGFWRYGLELNGAAGGDGADASSFAEQGPRAAGRCHRQRHRRAEHCAHLIGTHPLQTLTREHWCRTLLSSAPTRSSKRPRPSSSLRMVHSLLCKPSVSMR